MVKCKRQALIVWMVVLTLGYLVSRPFLRSTVYAAQVTDSFTLLNGKDDFDFKIPEDEFAEYVGDVVTTGSKVADVSVSEYGNRKMLEEAETDEFMRWLQTWLIDNEIIERPMEFMVTSTGIQASQLQDYETADKIYGSQLYSALYRIYYGNLRSRYLSVMTPSFTAGGEYCGFIHQMCVTSNVYELYVQELLRKGMLQKGELAESEYSDYLYSEVNNSGVSKYENPLVTGEQTLAAWNANTYPFGYLYSDPEKSSIWYKDSKGRCAFGNGFEYIEGNDSLTIKSKINKSPGILKEERMTLIKALQVVEKFMRLSEADMSDLEASIVMYKYGVSGLQYLSDEEYATVAFMIAKGVLDFEDLNTGFYSTVTWGDMLPVLYRVANKNARIAFSSIQLTDGETFWQSRGFSQTTIRIVEPEVDYVFYTDDVAEEMSPSEGVAALSLFRVYAATKKDATFTIVKMFDVQQNGEQSANEYTIFGVKLSSSTTKDELNEAASGSKVSIKKVEIVGDALSITFTVEAKSKDQAMAKVDDEITASITESKSFALTAYTKVTTSDGKTIMMLSKSSLEKAFPGQIDFVADKVLTNAASGSMAYIMPEDGYALVGNEVIVSEELLITDTGGDVYYNFEVIASLLNTEIRVLSNNTINSKCKIFFPATTTVPLYSSDGSNDSPIANVELVHAYNRDGDEDLLTLVNKNAHGSSYLYNVNQLSKGINTLFRTFTIDADADGEMENVTVLVDWTMTVPVLSGSTDLVGSLSKSKTWDEYFSVLYSEPTEGTAYRAVWDFNYGMSNTLAGFIFGKKGVNFVQCGWVVPKLTILVPPEVSGITGMKEASAILEKLGFASYIPDGYGSIVDYSTENMLDSYFGSTPRYFDSRVSEGNDKEAIKEFYRIERVQVLKGIKDQTAPEGLNKSVIYGASFIMDSVNTLYRNEDARVSIEMGNIGPQKATVYVNVIKQQESIKLGSTVKIVSHEIEYEFLYNSTISIGGQICYVLVPVDKNLLASRNGFLPKFSISTPRTGLSVSYQTSTVARTVTDFLKKKYYEEIFELDATDSFYNKVTDPANSFKLGIAATASVVKQLEYNNFYVFMDGSDFQVMKQKGVKSSKFNNLTGTKSFNEQEAYSIPVIYIPTDSMQISADDSGNWYLRKSGLQYFLDRSCIFYSGIVDDVINAIISEKLDYTTASNVPNGTELFINDTKWVKHGDYWESLPIYNGSIALKAKKNVASAISEMFGSVPIICSGRSLPLKNYIEETGIGSLYKDKVKTGKKCLTLDSKGKKSIMYVENGKTNYSTNKTPDCVLFRVKINGSLLLRPVASNKSAYTVCNRATQSMYSNQNISMLNLGSGDLNYGEDTDGTVYLGQSGFEQTGDFTEARTKFDGDYKEVWRRDFKTLVLMFVIFACSYLLVISWAVYVSLTRSTMLWLFNAIAGKRRSGGVSGIDIVKLFSFGIYNLDTPPTFRRTAAITVVCVMLITIAGKLQGGL